MEAKAGSMPPRETFTLDFGWRFALGDLHGAERETFDDSSWRRIDLPHDWSIEGPFDKDNPAGGSGAWAPGGIGWYRKRFALPAGSGDRRARLELDGIYHQASVYLNGMLLGRHDYGYSSFAFELGAAPKQGEQNLLAVRVDNGNLPNCRWYSGSGIYRSVRLVLFHPLRVDHWGTCVTTTRVAAASAVVSAVIEVRNDLGEAADFTVDNEIVAPDGRRMTGTPRAARAEAGQAVACRFTMKVRTPALWSPQRPSLYALVTRLHHRGRQVDEYETGFGIRKAEFRPRQGFFLNGVGVKLKGVCLHHDGGAVGAAVPMAIWERRLGLLKSMGCNAIRCSHNPPDPKLLDLCDSMGFLAIDEVFDKWEGDFAGPGEWWMRQAGFAANWEADLVSMLRRDRNHPSIILWSVGNETGQPGTDQLDPWLARLAARAPEDVRGRTARGGARRRCRSPRPLELGPEELPRDGRMLDDVVPGVPDAEGVHARCDGPPMGEGLRADDDLVRVPTVVEREERFLVIDAEDVDEGSAPHDPVDFPGHLRFGR